MDIFPPTPTTLQACDAFLWAFNFTPLLSLYIFLAQIQTMIAVRVCASAVSLHSALNEPIMGVYVALMRVSVRRETLHRSPPNQWGLACYTTPRFSAFTRPPSLHPFLLSPHRSLSLSLFLSSFSVQLARDKSEVSGQLAMKRGLNRTRWGHHNNWRIRSLVNWVLKSSSVSKKKPLVNQKYCTRNRMIVHVGSVRYTVWW